jgi:galactofuranose transport system substrate-binding protein
VKHSRSRALLATASAACLIALLAGCSSGSGTASSTASAGDAAAQASAAVAAGTVDPKSPMGQTLAYIQSGKRPTGNPKVAFIDACTSNTYCQAGLQGAKDASAKFGIDLTLYDSNFSSDTELKNVQDAVQKGYDGYVMAPLTQTTGCSNFKLLQATGKPVVNDNSPMCGNPDYTKGTSGFVAVQTAAYFQQHIENAFKSCTSSCKVLVVDQGVTSDLYKLWETALTAAKAKYPKVDVVVDQPTDFVPETTLQVTQDALQKHADISLVVSYWDDATRGAEQAIVAAGKTPGKDVRIYSMGATKDALAKIKAGTWNESTVLLPYEEGYYAFAQMARKLATGEDTPGYTDLSGAPSVASGPGSIFITAANADKFAPKY